MTDIDDHLASTGGPTPWSAQRRVVVALGAVVLAGLAFLAGAGAFDDVIGSGDGVVEVRWGDAVTVASDEAGGVVAQVLLAEHDGERCVAVSAADETSVLFSDERCADLLVPWDDPDFEIVRLDDHFGSFGQFPLQRADGSWQVALAGSMHPNVVRVTAHFGDGAEYSFVTRNPGGWFVTLLPDAISDPSSDTGYLVNAPVRLELFDADGTRVASVDLTTVLGRTTGAV